MTNGPGNALGRDVDTSTRSGDAGSIALKQDVVEGPPADGFRTYQPSGRPKLVFGQDRLCRRCHGSGQLEVIQRLPGDKTPSTLTTPCALCSGTGRTT